MEDVWWSLNPTVLPDLKNSTVGLSQIQTEPTSDTQNMLVPDTNQKVLVKSIGTDHLAQSQNELCLSVQHLF